MDNYIKAIFIAVCSLLPFTASHANFGCSGHLVGSMGGSTCDEVYHKNHLPANDIFHFLTTKKDSDGKDIYKQCHGDETLYDCHPDGVRGGCLLIYN